LRDASVWNTNASISMPTPVTTHPMSSGPGAALAAIWDGRAKIPLPIIDPTTIAVRAASPSPALGNAVRVEGGGGTSVSDIVVSQLDWREVAGVASCD
jgi:hypothetical protein